MKMRSKMWVSGVSRTMLWLLLTAGVAAALQLPPDIQADRYLLEAEKQIQEQDHASAKQSLDRILELKAQHDLEIPKEFYFRYAEVVERLGLYAEAVEFVTKYLMLAGRDGAHYRAALDLLSMAEDAMAAAEEARERAEAERKRAEARQRANDELAQRQVVAAAQALPQDTLKSGGLGPEMVTVASGRFQYYTYYNGEHLQWVDFDKSFAISKYEVTRGEFQRFVKASRYRTAAEKGGYCYSGSRLSKSSWKRPRSPFSLKHPIFDQTGAHPVVCVSLRDAINYAAWLSHETGHRYRLPSAAEWQYAARAGSKEAQLYTKDTDPTFRNNCGRSNLDEDNDFNCTDGVLNTAEVGRFPPNGIGLHDMVGNVSEWVLACGHVYDRRDSIISLRLVPDGAPEDPDGCKDYFVAIGGAYYHAGSPARFTDYREKDFMEISKYRDGTTYTGFRVVRDLTK